MLNKFLRYGLIVLLGILVLIGFWWALASGSRAAKSKQILKDVAAIQEGLEFFYDDQERYPSTDEFADSNLMRGYLSEFPPQQFPSAKCSQTYQYINTFAQSYELRFCLPAAKNGYQAGWNTVKK